MARSYRLTFGRRALNVLVRGLLSAGLAPSSTRLLTVRGRKSGRPHSTPVNLVEEGGQRWIVAPYGPVSWVKNARAAGEVSLARGGRTETVQIAELTRDDAAQVLKTYLKHNAITRPYFNAAAGSPVQSFMAETANHPVFQIVD